MMGPLVWFTGLPSSGKTTLARAVERILRDEGVPCCLLDGDEVRACLVPSPGYGSQARADFYQTLAHLAALLCRQGLTVLVAATAHRRADREYASAAAPGGYLEVLLETPLAECERRDSKGLYDRARAGEIADFPGVQDDYQPHVGPLSRSVFRIEPSDLNSDAASVVERMRSMSRAPSRSPDDTRSPTLRQPAP